MNNEKKSPLILLPPTYSILKDRVEDALRQAVDYGMSGDCCRINEHINLLMKEVFG